MLERKSMIYCVMQVHNWHCMIIVWKQFLVVFLKCYNVFCLTVNDKNSGDCPALLVGQSSWVHMHIVYTNLMTAKEQKLLNDVTSALKSLNSILGL